MWMQQLREAIPTDHTYRFLIHDRDSIFSHQLDQRVRDMGLRVLKRHPRVPRQMPFASGSWARCGGSVWTL
jgi:putative transposase